MASGACGLTDGSVAGAWRLPNVRELQSLIDYGNFGLVLPAGHPFTGAQSNFYWSSTTLVFNPIYAWGVDLDGVDILVNKTFSGYVWPVRGGQ